MPVFSIIVPCFNYGHLLAETLESVLCQSTRDWECIVVDDGSTDNTAEVAARFVGSDSRFRYLHQENCGLSAARNAGIRQAAGEFLQFLDADDLIEEKKLELQGDFLRKRPELGIVFGEARYFHSDSPDIFFSSIDGSDRAVTCSVEGTGAAVLQHLLVDNITVVSAPLVRRKVLDTIAPFDETLRSLEDWDFWLRCALQGVYFAYLGTPKTSTMIRVHTTSMSKNSNKMLGASLEVRQRLRPLLKDSRLTFINEKGIVHTQNALARHDIRAGKVAAGVATLLANLPRTLVYRLLKTFRPLQAGRG